MYFLIDNDFPPVELADENGLLAIGGQLSPESILKAYPLGIFPWYNEDDPIMWWSPDPRMALFPGNLHLSSSMRQVLRKKQFSFTIDKAFDKVIAACRETRMKNEGSWIHPEIIQTYTSLHHRGFAHSVEAWYGNELAGGLYGLLIGKVFFGESMFSKKNNASKAALAYLCHYCLENDIRLIDCQVANPHLESMGAIDIGREEFLMLLQKYCT